MSGELFTTVADGVFREQAVSLWLQPAPAGIRGDMLVAFRCQAAQARFADAKWSLLGSRSITGLLGSGRRIECNSGFGRDIYKYVKPKSLRFAYTENYGFCDLVVSQAPPGSWLSCTIPISGCLSQVDGGGKSNCHMPFSRVFWAFSPSCQYARISTKHKRSPPVQPVPANSFMLEKGFLEIGMEACSWKIILVALNRNTCAGDAGTMLILGTMLVMGSGPPHFFVGGKGILFLNFSSTQRLDFKACIFKIE